ncbi:IMPACT family protein [Nesterenkonia alkaliphila]|uniref:YigZ family protein n=1 Tax=Nesterenkonia alkaliphila TaxID=1463631 RepID=A0A7K1UMG1_9MICC|nr:YigZ family protein [Nesterenkonia alkaliphila]MVT27626.1 YigZ family protein [Nesterenkonia alkaliphila]GFZ85674.1 YigZ family protein [Nesterenkonia alkaliphila]
MTEARYTVLRPGVRITAQIERKKSRFLTVLERAETTEQAQELVEELRREHHSARHHCSAWAIGPDRRVQRANDDGEPSGTAGAPMLEALTKAQMPSGEQDLSDAVGVVVRWFGGTLLGAGGLVSAYSDSMIAALQQAQAQGAFLSRRRMRLFTLETPFAKAGRWENELRAIGAEVPCTDYAAVPGAAVMQLAVQDEDASVDSLHSRVAALTQGGGQLHPAGTTWVDL